MKKIALLFGLLLLMSCEDDATFEIPEDPPKIVVKTVLDPYAPGVFGIEVYVGNSRPLSDSTGVGFIDSAEVILFKNQQAIDTLELDTFQTFRPSYYSFHKPEEDQLYRILVRVKGYRDVWGETYVPNRIVPQNLVVDSLKRSISFSFKDQPTQDNYYMFYCRRSSGSTFPLVLRTLDPDVESYIPDDFLQPTEGTIGYYLFITDRFFDGKSKSLSFNYDYLNETNSENVELEFFLVSITRDYYLHKRQVILQDYNDLSIFGEPYRLHSNVHNGYGLVSAATTFPVIFKP